jgi:hypothetical protein
MCEAVECRAHISNVGSLSGVAIRVTARTWAKDSSPVLNAARISGRRGNARATRNFSRAAFSENPQRHCSQWAADGQPFQPCSSSNTRSLTMRR